MTDTEMQTTAPRPAPSLRSKKSRRLAVIAGMAAMLAVAAGLVLFALRDSIVFFHSPADIAEKAVKPGTRLRLGGLVKAGSVERGPGQTVKFEVTDGRGEIVVRYTGILPDLFREGQGVVAEGVLETASTFKADSVLAKHDETYMPREVADALKKQGVWKEGAPAPRKP